MTHRSSPSVTLVSHASALIEIDGCLVLTDPWFSGTAFNDSWKLLIEPADLSGHWDSIDYLWISHEHPDHFHLPTLRALPQRFRERVTVLFQRSSDWEKMRRTLVEHLGFSHFRLLEHRQWTPLANGVEAYCYHFRQLDSALALRHGGHAVLNLNDCEASDRDLAAMRRDIGPVGILLNQFSIAGFSGIEESLPPLADRILANMARDHRALGATTTIPFASFVYFCCHDNALVNRHANSPQRVADHFAGEGLDLTILLPGETLRQGEEHDSAASLQGYARIYDGLADRPMSVADKVEMGRLQEAFSAMRDRLRRNHGRWAFGLLPPVTVAVPDLDVRLRLSFADPKLAESDAEPDVEINSQPLHFMLSHNFGLQTLGVSGRYRLLRNYRRWLRYRILFAMQNAGLGLSLRKMVSARQLGFLWRRRGDLLAQLRYRLRRALSQ